MAYTGFGSLGSLSGAGPGPTRPVFPWRGPTMQPAQPPMWGGQQPMPPVHPAWGFNPPHFGTGAEGLQNHLASLRQMSNPQFHPAMFQHFMSPRYY